jgi:hypothetical protein
LIPIPRLGFTSGRRIVKPGGKSAIEEGIRYLQLAFPSLMTLIGSGWHRLVWWIGREEVLLTFLSINLKGPNVGMISSDCAVFLDHRAKTQKTSIARKSNELSVRSCSRWHFRAWVTPDSYLCTNQADRMKHTKDLLSSSAVGSASLRARREG